MKKIMILIGLLIFLVGCVTDEVSTEPTLEECWWDCYYGNGTWIEDKCYNLQRVNVLGIIGCTIVYGNTPPILTRTPIPQINHSINLIFS